MSGRSTELRPFDPRSRDFDPARARRYAAFEVAHTAADFAAATLFVIGSILFFFEQTMTIGTWAFLAGSICFLLKPSIRMARELWLVGRKDITRLADAAPEAPERAAQSPGPAPGLREDGGAQRAADGHGTESRHDRA